MIFSFFFLISKKKKEKLILKRKITLNLLAKKSKIIWIIIKIEFCKIIHCKIKLSLGCAHFLYFNLQKINGK